MGSQQTQETKKSQNREKRKKNKSRKMSNETKWSSEEEVSLFQALRDHKPIRIAKNFHMLSIMHKIKISSGRPFTADQIWRKLNSLYQLDMLEETEIMNFQQCERTVFSLPARPEINENNNDESIGKKIKY